MMEGRHFWMVIMAMILIGKVVDTHDCSSGTVDGNSLYERNSCCSNFGHMDLNVTNPVTIYLKAKFGDTSFCFRIAFITNKGDRAYWDLTKNQLNVTELGSYIAMNITIGKERVDEGYSKWKLKIQLSNQTYVSDASERVYGTSLYALRFRIDDPNVDLCLERSQENPNKGKTMNKISAYELAERSINIIKIIVMH